MKLESVYMIFMIVVSVIGGFFAFYKYYLKWKYWKPKIHLDSGRLNFLNDGKNEIIITKITAISGGNKYIATQIRTIIGKEIQRANIIYPNQPVELEFDIDNHNFNTGQILIEYQIEGKVKSTIIELSKSDTVNFINNRSLKMTVI